MQVNNRLTLAMNNMAMVFWCMHIIFLLKQKINIVIPIFWLAIFSTILNSNKILLPIAETTVHIQPTEAELEFCWDHVQMLTIQETDRLDYQIFLQNINERLTWTIVLSFLLFRSFTTPIKQYVTWRTDEHLWQY